MVQQEIKKKTKVYGSVAFLSAISLVALIYVFGAAPVIFNPNASPIKTFSSYEALKNFLTDNTTRQRLLLLWRSSGQQGFRQDSSKLPIPAPAAS